MISQELLAKYSADPDTPECEVISDINLNSFHMSFNFSGSNLADLTIRQLIKTALADPTVKSQLVAWLTKHKPDWQDYETEITSKWFIPSGSVFSMELGLRAVMYSMSYDFDQIELAISY